MFLGCHILGYQIAMNQSYGDWTCG